MEKVTGEIWPSFNDFWELYDKKVGKVNAIKEWNKLSHEDHLTIMSHAPDYVKSREKKYRKDAERYLKHRTFEDEIITHLHNEQQTRTDTRKSDLVHNLAKKYQQP